MKVTLRLSLIVALAALVIAACSPLKKYQHRPEVLAWEKEIAALEALDSTEDHPSNAILFTGSSSIRLWNSIEADMQPYPVIRRGYGGAKLTDFIVYEKRLIYPHTFRAVAIFVANDITGGKNDKTPEEVLTLFKFAVKQIRKKYPDTPVFFIEITPTNSRWKAWPNISKANNLIKAWSDTQRHVHFIATSHRFLNEEGKPRSNLFIDDQLHLNRDGYKLWAEIIRAEMDKILK